MNWSHDEKTVIYYMGKPLTQEQYLELLDSWTKSGSSALANPYLYPIKENKPVIQYTRCKYCRTRNKSENYNCCACGAPL